MMHVSNLISPAPAPAAPRSSSGLETNSGFGSYFESQKDPQTAGNRAPARPERRDASPQEAPAPMETKAPVAAREGADTAPPQQDVNPELAAGVVHLTDTAAPAPRAGGEDFAVDADVATAPQKHAERVIRPAVDLANPQTPAQGAKAAASEEAMAAKAPATTAAAQTPAAEVSARAAAAAPPPVVPAAAPQPTAKTDAQAVQADGDQPAPRETVVVRRVAAPESPPPVSPQTAGAPKTAPKPATPTVASPAVSGESIPVADAGAEFHADSVLSDIRGTETRHGADHVMRAEASRHEAPRPVAQQMAEAARALRDGPVELTLKPEELGRVRMTLATGADGAMTMTVQAERPETLDLMRRHINDLARELQQMGFSDLNFSFGRDRSGSGQAPVSASWADDGPEQPVAAIPLAAHGFANRPAVAPATGGLDLRL